VLHRRADLERIRKVHSAELESYNELTRFFVINCEAALCQGTGFCDGGRTIPSVASLIGSEAKVIELEVIKVG